MKKSLYSLIITLLSFPVARAQTETGRWMAGTELGNLYYSSQSSYRNVGGSFSPLAGYFVASGLAIGTGLPVSFGRLTSKVGSVRSGNTSVGLSPFVRYYIGSSPLRPYAGVAYAYSRTSQFSDSPNPVQQTRYSGFSTSLIPRLGLAYFVSHAVVVDLGLGYVWTSSNSGIPAYNSAGLPQEPATYTSEYLALNMGFSLFFGK